jgi:hypothetical protein
MCDPMGFVRTRSTSTHGDFAAARSASMLWHEHPCARMIPFSVCQTVHQDDIQILRPQFFPKPIEIGFHLGWITRPRFRHHRHFFARNMLQCIRGVRMAAVRIGEVEKSQPIVVSVLQKSRQTGDTQLICLA